MKLRTRLIIAFLLLSVLPLTAVTVYSYYSSRRAFERAVETETDALAAELGQRMELVTADLEQRVDRLWDMPVRTARADGEARGAEPRVPAAPGMGDVAVFLGQAASFLDRVEFTPVAEAASAPRVPAPAPRGGRPAPPTPPAPNAQHRAPLPPAAPIVIDLREILAKAAQNDPDARKAAEQARKFIEQLQLKAGPVAQLGMQAAAVGLRIGAAELNRIAQEKARAASEKKRTMKLKGSWVDMPIHRDGAVVANVNAQLNLKQILNTVLSMSRREQGEIAFAIDAENQIYTPKPADRAHLEALAFTGQSGMVHTDQPWVVVKKQDTSGVTFGIARPIGAALAEIRRASARNLGLGLFVIVIALIGIVPMSAHMTRDLSRLTAGVRALARGDLNARVPVTSSDEFGELAKAFNQMTYDLAEHQKLVVDQERLHRELELCRQIQNEMLPHEPLRLGLTEVKGVSIPAREVGGDFFNYFLLPGGEIALLVGDVSGKGVGAALLMANIQATLRARLPLEDDLAKLADLIDREIDANTPRGVFLTLFVGILDTQRMTLRYVNAGHNPQFVLRGSGQLERMPGTGLPIGMFSGHGYTERSLALADNDLLFFSTAGMVEAENESGDLFGADRLEALLVRAHNDGLDDLLTEVEATVKAFRGASEPFDDATMMALRLRGGEPARA